MTGWQLLFLLWSVNNKMPLMVLTNTETEEETIKRDMTYGEQVRRNAVLNRVPYVWVGVNKK